MNIDDFEKKFNEIEALRNSGKLSDKEYATLINGMNLESTISGNAKELQKKQKLYKAMVAAAKIAKTLM